MWRKVEIYRIQPQADASAMAMDSEVFSALIVLTKSLDTAVTMTAYGPLMNNPHNITKPVCEQNHVPQMYKAYNLCTTYRL